MNRRNFIKGLSAIAALAVIPLKERKHSLFGRVIYIEIYHKLDCTYLKCEYEDGTISLYKSDIYINSKLPLLNFRKIEEQLVKMSFFVNEIIILDNRKLKLQEISMTWRSLCQKNQNKDSAGRSTGKDIG